MVGEIFATNCTRKQVFFCSPILTTIAKFAAERLLARDPHTWLCCGDSKHRED